MPAVAGISLEVDGPVASLTLCRPERRNAQSPATWLELARIGSVLDAGVRVVVVRGEGPSFSAGLDRRMFTADGVPGEGSLADITGGDDAAAAETIAGYQAGFSWLRECGAVSIAAVQGHAVGAGFQLALACDIRLAAPDAQFSMAEPTLGLVPDLGGSRPLVAAVGYERALEMCATGRRVGAAEAERIGLVSRVVDDLDRAVAEQVGAILAADAGAVAATKRLLDGALERTPAEQLRAEREAQVVRLRALLGSATSTG